MNIRPMKDSDLENCVAVVSGILGEPEDVTWNDIEEYLEWDSPEALLLVAENDKGNFLGFAALITEAWNRCARIEWIGLLPSARGAGIGTALMERMKAHAKSLDVRKIYVNTGVVNRGAIDYYLSAGFRPEALFSDWYDWGHDALWMSFDMRSLKPRKPVRRTRSSTRRKG